MSYQLMQKSGEQIKIEGGDISFDMQEVFKFGYATKNCNALMCFSNRRPCPQIR